MSFFGRILEKLGMRKPEAASRSSQGTPAGRPPSGAPSQQSAPQPRAQAPSAASPTPVAMVDVVSHLEKLAAQNPQDLNWKTSIVDLLKLLDIDSSLEARKELAAELGAPPAVMGESAKMNMWLHRTVLQQIAANGGNVPKELLD